MHISFATAYSNAWFQMQFQSVKSIKLKEYLLPHSVWFQTYYLASWNETIMPKSMAERWHVIGLSIASNYLLCRGIYSLRNTTRCPQLVPWWSPIEFLSRTLYQKVTHLVPIYWKIRIFNVKRCLIKWSEWPWMSMKKSKHYTNCFLM